jgi:hypothetical protein
MGAIKSNSKSDKMRGDPTALDRAVVSIASLSALGDRVTLVDPVRPEIISDVKSLHVGKPERPQLLVSGFDIRATDPGAAAAIDDDKAVLVEAGDTLA